MKNTKDCVGFVQCIACETLFRFKKGNSTSNLKRHLDNCRRVGESQQLQHSLSSSDVSESDNTLDELRDRHFRQPESSPGHADRSQTENTLDGSSSSSSQSPGTGTGAPRVYLPAPPGQEMASPRSRGGTKTKPPRQVPQHVKDKMTDACVKMCSVDLRPFSVVNGPGFKNVAQSLIEVGAKFGNVNAEEVLPHSPTISRKTCVVAEKVREKFLPEVKEALEMKSCAFDADMWSDKYTKTAYLTTTAQYVTEDFKLKSLVLFTVDFPAEQAKTGANIRKFSTTALEKLYISEADIEHVTHLTNGGANMISAYASRNRLPCTAHNLATVLRHLLDEKFLRLNAPSVMTSLEVARNIVTYIKRSGLCKLLPHSVKTMIEVRWDTVVEMLTSLCDAFPHVMQILIQKREQHRLDGWDGEIVTDLIDLLLKFKLVTKELQAKKVPTIQNVLVRYHDLLEHCKTKDEDSEVCI